MEDFITSGHLDTFPNSGMVNGSKSLHFHNSCTFILTVITCRKISSPSKKIVQGGLEGGMGAFVEFITHNL